MSKITLPPLPAPDHTTPVQFACDGQWWREDQMRAYGEACARAALEAAALACEAVAAGLDNACDRRLGDIFSACEECADAIRALEVS